VPMEPGEVVLGADTTVVIDDHVLEKPRDTSDALRMIGLLSGREHEVITGICLRSESKKLVDVAITRVRFAKLTREEIETYAASGEPMDKAGAYAIQGLASKFIDRIEGDYFNVVGLPVALVYRHLRALLEQDLYGVGGI
jgi:septum formation protein